MDAAKADRTDALPPALRTKLVIEELETRDEASAEYQEWLSIPTDRTALIRVESLLILFGESDSLGWEPLPLQIVERAFDKL